MPGREMGVSAEIRRGRSMLNLDKINFDYGDKRVLSDVSFSLHAGEKAALIGPNGVGKTTLINIIRGELSPQSGDITMPSNTRIGYLPQTVSELVSTDVSIYDFVIEGRGLNSLKGTIDFHIHQMERGQEVEKNLQQYSEAENLFDHLDGYGVEHSVKKLMDGMELDKHALTTKVKKLSGGQKTKLLLTRILFSKPDLLLLDEPTNHLDKPVMDWLAGYLKGFQGSSIIVSHDRDFLDGVVTKVVRLYKDEPHYNVFKGNYSESLEKIEARKKHEIKKQKIAQKDLKRYQKTISKWRMRGKRASEAKKLERKVDQIKKDVPDVTIKEKKPILKINIKEQSYKRVLSLKKISKSFGDNQVLTNVNLSVSKRENVGILGPNGSGKTTLIKIVLGKLQPDSGSVDIGDKVDIGYFAQEQEGLNLDNTAIEEVMKNSTGASYQLVRSILGGLMLEDRVVGRKLSSLSPGERAKVALAKIMVSGTNTLILDEPTNHLDIPSKKALSDLLVKYDGTIIMTTHDEELLDLVDFDKLLILPDEKVEV